MGAVTPSSCASWWAFIAVWQCALWAAGKAQIDEGDKAVLLGFLSKVEKAAKLGWESDAEPCESWKGISCAGSFVSAISLANEGLGGNLTPDLNKLKSLESVALQGNGFVGELPSLRGLEKLRSCYLDANDFDAIPSDFFQDLPNLRFFSLNDNPNLNASVGGWRLPDSVSSAVSLTNLSLANTSLAGVIPSFLGSLPSLTTLRLAYNRLQGSIPSSFSDSRLHIFQANNQLGPSRLSGTLDSVSAIASLRQLWLHQNDLTGLLPPNLSRAISLTDLRLNGNQLVGPIPESYAQLPLSVFAVENNRLDGPIPSFGGTSFTYANNLFCRDEPGAPCSPQVAALLDFLGSVGYYPPRLVDSWSGDDPCGASWVGIVCDSTGRVVVVNLANSNISGTISPRIADLSFLIALDLSHNSLSGTIPSSLVHLLSLKTLNVSYNNFTGPVPAFSANVTLSIAGNPFIDIQMNGTASNEMLPTDDVVPNLDSSTTRRRRTIAFAVVVSAVAGISVAAAALFLSCRKRWLPFKIKDHAGKQELPKFERLSEPIEESKTGGNGGFALSFRCLQMATDGFSRENFLGRGGFGEVYRGKMEDGTEIAVKRMDGAARQGLKEFESELNLLTKLRHRNLVAILGYSAEGGERAVVYEYMAGGPLSHRLFLETKTSGEAAAAAVLEWKSRMSIALDVARGLEYLHLLARNSFVHRDLKPSNILLDANFRAKISDFGLVRLLPVVDGDRQPSSLHTAVAGTFGYLAPEYALTGHITTKADVFSFGVVLMELITGRRALDERFPEEQRHLVPWFRRLAGSSDRLLEAVDVRMATAQDESAAADICGMAELAKHCTQREPSMRPDMSHAVNVLQKMVMVWKPWPESAEEEEEAELTAEAVRRKLLDWDESSSRSKSTGSNID